MATIDIIQEDIKRSDLSAEHRKQVLKILELAVQQGLSADALSVASLIRSLSNRLPAQVYLGRRSD